MSAEERQNLVEKVAECLEACDLGHVPVQQYREMVAPLQADSVDGRFEAKVVCELPST